MRTLLLLAGRSKRFWPLSEKALWPINSKTLIEHQIDRLKAAGFNNITLVGGAHNLDEVKRVVPNLPIIEQENLDLGMQGALLSALPSCGNDPVFIVSSNDVITMQGYKDLHSAFEHAGAAGGFILAKKVSSYFPGGYLTLEKNRITSIVEKPGKGNEPSDLVTIVAHIHRDAADLLSELKKVKAKNDDGYEIALANLFKSRNYEVLPYEGLWYPVKYPWHLLPLMESMLAEIQKPLIHSKAKIHETAVIDGLVIIDKGVKVFAHASVVGPCYIGPHTVIGNNALVRQSSIGPDCVIGYNTEVVRSTLYSQVWTHSSYIGDSMIGRNVAFGAGTITANLRLDEGEVYSQIGKESIGTESPKCGVVIGDDCRVGVRVTFSPGIKIGKGSFISSDSNVSVDVPDMSFVKMKAGEIDIRKNIRSTPNPEGREAFRKQAGVER